MTAVVAYALAVALGLLWFWLTATPVRPRGEPDLSAPGIALLRRRGRRSAITAAVSELAAAGLVEVDTSGRLRRTGAPAPGGLSEVADAVHRTLAQPRRQRLLAARAPVRAALARTTAELARTGVAPTRRRWWQSRLALLGAVVVTLLGITRAGALPPLLVLPAFLLVAAAPVAWFRPRRTIAGARLLRRLPREEAAPRPPATGQPPSEVNPPTMAP